MGVIPHAGKRMRQCCCLDRRELSVAPEKRPPELTVCMMKIIFEPVPIFHACTVNRELRIQRSYDRLSLGNIDCRVRTVF
jgi:hypothetical protein